MRDLVSTAEIVAFVVAVCGVPLCEAHLHTALRQPGPLPPPPNGTILAHFCGGDYSGRCGGGMGNWWSPSIALIDDSTLVIAAEGTRSSRGEWKSGFYNIARAANVPIVPAWVCNTRRIVGFGPAIIPSANYGETLLEIARFMRGKLPEFERFKVLERQALQLIEENGT